MTPVYSGNTQIFQESIASLIQTESRASSPMPIVRPKISCLMTDTFGAVPETYQSRQRSETDAH